MSSLLKRTNGLISLVPNEDHTGKEGYAVKASSGKAALVTSVTADYPIGVIVDGEPTAGKSTIALADAASGTVRVKLDATPGTVVLGTYLTQTTSGTFKAAVSTNIQCARALESGAANELIEACLFKPIPAP